MFVFAKERILINRGPIILKKVRIFMTISQFVKFLPIDVNEKKISNINLFSNR